MKTFDYRYNEKNDFIYPSFYLLVKDYFLNNKKVLDLGAGTGSYMNFFGKKSVGIEFSIPNQELIKKKGFKVYDINLNKYPYNLDENNFDFAFASHIIEHLYSPLLFIGEIKKFIKDDGKIIIGYPIRFSLVRIFDPFFSLSDLYHFYDFSLKGMKVLLKANDLEIEKIYYDIPFASRWKLFNFLQKIVQSLPYCMVSWWSNAIYIVAKKI